MFKKGIFAELHLFLVCFVTETEENFSFFTKIFSVMLKEKVFGDAL